MPTHSRHDPTKGSTRPGPEDSRWPQTAPAIPASPFPIGGQAPEPTPEALALREQLEDLLSDEVVARSHSFLQSLYDQLERRGELSGNQIAAIAEIQGRRDRKEIPRGFRSRRYEGYGR